VQAVGSGSWNQTTGLTDSVLRDTYFRDIGVVWKQGQVANFYHSRNCTVTHIDAANCSSDGISFGGVDGIANCELSHSYLHDFGFTSTQINLNESISDW
jgi:hypothetical protein